MPPAAGPRLHRRGLLGLLASAVAVALVTTALVGFGSADSDGDGLSNYTEQFGWRTIDRALHVTDPFSPDSDGDGLTDGEEAGEPSGAGTYALTSDPNRADSDADLLNDKTETDGWQSRSGVTYRTDPMVTDTDGDGLTDGEEAGDATGSAPRVEFAVFSDPMIPDTDDDGLDDAVEADLSLDPFDADTDGDTLPDAVEVIEIGTAPDAADTDEDGFDDGYEVAHQASQGLDPLWPDEQVDPSTYAWEFAQGAVLGEIAPGDSLPWLAGNLISGGSSFIPGIGWVVGGAADVRDAVGAAIREDWVGAGFSVVGLVPAAGDAAAIPAKVAKFLTRHPELAPAAGAAVVGLSWVPQTVKVSALRSASPDNWDDLRSRGVSEETLLRLQSGKITADALVEAMLRTDGSAGTTARWFSDGYAAEAFLESLYPGARTQVSFSTVDCVEVCNDLMRRVDVVGADDIAHESKVGYVYLTASTRAQIQSDAYLIDSGMIPGATWHFFASATTHKIGASPAVLKLLREQGIAYEIHPPA